MNNDFDSIAKIGGAPVSSSVLRDCVVLAVNYSRQYHFPFSVYHAPQMPHSHAEGSMLLSHVYMAYSTLMQWVWKKNFEVSDGQGGVFEVPFTQAQKDLVFKYQNLLKDWVFLHDIGKGRVTRIFVKDGEAGHEISVRDYFKLGRELRADPMKISVVQDHHEEEGALWLGSLAKEHGVEISPLLLALIRGHRFGISEIFNPNALLQYYQNLLRQMGGSPVFVDLLYIAITLDIVSRKTKLYRFPKEICMENSRNFKGAHVLFRALQLSLQFKRIFSVDSSSALPSQPKEKSRLPEN